VVLFGTTSSWYWLTCFFPAGYTSSEHDRNHAHVCGNGRWWWGPFSNAHFLSTITKNQTTTVHQTSTKLKLQMSECSCEPSASADSSAVAAVSNTTEIHQKTLQPTITSYGRFCMKKNCFCKPLSRPREIKLPILTFSASALRKPDTQQCFLHLYI